MPIPFPPYPRAVPDPPRDGGEGPESETEAPESESAASESRETEERHRLTDARLHELLTRLRLRIHYAPSTQRELEERAGFSKGYLSQILHGNIDLKLSHLLAVIDALEVDPADFFAELFDERRFAAHSLLSLGRRGGERGGERGSERSGARSTPLGLELARLYGLGLESLDELLRRLDRCEAAFRELEERGLLEMPPSEASAPRGRERMT